MTSSRQGDKGVTEFDHACVLGFHCVSEKLFTRRNTMNSCWPVQTVFNCYNNERTLIVIGNGTAVFGKRNVDELAKVVVYPVGSCLFQVELAYYPSSK